MSQCRCVFCEYRRAIDVKDVLDRFCQDEDFLKMVADRVGDISNPALANIGLGAMIHDAVPLASEILARLAVAEANGVEPSTEFLPSYEVEALCKLVVAFCSFLHLAYQPDLDRGKKLSDNVKAMLNTNSGRMEHGSSRLH